MEISQKDFSELTALVSSMTKTLKNFDDRLNEVEGNVDALGETVTVDLPKAIAEQVGDAVETAIANDAAPVDNEAAVEGEEEVVAEDGGEPCPECGNSPCTCGEGGEAQEFCGDSESFEDFSEKVTTTIEDLAHHVNDIAERVNKMFIKVFSEEEVTSTEADVQKVEGALKEAPEDFKTSEDDGGVVKATVVTETVSPVVPPVTPPVADETAQFSEKRYDQIKDIFNL